MSKVRHTNPLKTENGFYKMNLAHRSVSVNKIKKNFRDFKILQNVSFQLAFVSQVMMEIP